MTTSASLAAGEVAVQPSLSSLSQPAANTDWYGLYHYYIDDFTDPDWAGDTLPASGLIKNGTASFNQSSLPPITASSINYEIPAVQTVSGDSLVFEVKLKSVSNTVGLSMYNKENGFGAYLFIDTPVNGKRTYSVSAGSTYKLVSVKPLPDYTSFHTVQFALKGNTAFVYVDNKLMVKMTYVASQQSKRITMLTVRSGLDKIECDRVRLLNSFTRKVRMKEEFNKDGQGNTLFY